MERRGVQRGAEKDDKEANLREGVTRNLAARHSSGNLYTQYHKYAHTTTQLIFPGMKQQMLYLLIASTLLCGCFSNNTTKCSEQSGQIGQIEVEGDKELYHIEASLPIDFTDDMEWILRYDDNDVQELRDRATSEEKECDVLFFGSSSIRLWHTLSDDMAPLRVVNRGYGGAMLRDIHYNYHTVLADYQPRAFVFYCDNDLGGFGHDLHPTELFDLYRLLVERLQSDYPGKEIFILSIKFNENRAAKREEHRLFNALMADYAAYTEGVTFVDVNTPILNVDGSVNNDYFEDDLLHVNRKGYEVWSSVLKPQLEEWLNRE